MWPTKILELIPQSYRLPIILVLSGVGLAYGHEIRYVTASDFTKSYVLNLRGEIRELRKELREAATASEKERIQEQIDAMIDELCYEVPTDSYCKERA